MSLLLNYLIQRENLIQISRFIWWGWSLVSQTFPRYSTELKAKSLIPPFHFLYLCGLQIQPIHLIQHKITIREEDIVWKQQEYTWIYITFSLLTHSCSSQLNAFSGQIQIITIFQGHFNSFVLTNLRPWEFLDDTQRCHFTQLWHVITGVGVLSDGLITAHFIFSWC